jgi:hypothetical protein
MVVASGTATRPAGSDSYWPPVGTRVAWHLAPILVRLGGQAESLGWTVYSIGNVDHLKKHGDHSPWSVVSGVTKTRGIVYAIDVMVPDTILSLFKIWMLAYCKSSADTTWIDFFNLGNEQFNFAGKKTANSTDHHLHLSVKKGSENKVSDLFNAWRDRNKKPTPAPTTPPVATTPKERRDDTVFLVKKGSAVYKTDGFKGVHVEGPATREGYKDLVRALGDPVVVNGDLSDFGIPPEEIAK